MTGNESIDWLYRAKNCEKILNIQVSYLWENRAIAEETIKNQDR